MHIIVMDKIDPDWKLDQNIDKENSKWKLQRYSELIEASQVPTYLSAL